MNEPTHGSNDRESDRDMVDRLRALRPRAPRIDWDAIRSTHVAEEMTIPPVKSALLFFTESRQRAAVWLSGMAAGAAITFCTMHWFILSDLRAKIEWLEQAASETEQKAVTDPSANDRAIATSKSSIDLNTLLDSPRLSVGSYRSRPDRLVNTPSNPQRSETSSASIFDDPLRTKIENAPAASDLKPHPTEQVVDRLRLLRELQQDIY